ELLTDPYVLQPPPKSTGREYYGASYAKKLLLMGRRYRYSANDLIRAATLFTAASIRFGIEAFASPKANVDQIIVSGGGAKNPLIFAFSAVFKRTNEIRVVNSDPLTVPPAPKKALPFAFPPSKPFPHPPPTIPTATGARGPAILGKISYARPR